MGRAIMILEGLGMHEAITTPHHDSIEVYLRPYDHPFFGQIFLAGALGTISYPDILGIRDKVSICQYVSCGNIEG